MENLDAIVSPNVMATASSRLSPGLGPGVDVGAMVGCNVGVGSGVAVTLEESPVIGDSLLSVAAQADATRAATAKMPTIQTLRNLWTDNLYLSFVKFDAWAILINSPSIRWGLLPVKARYFHVMRWQQASTQRTFNRPGTFATGRQAARQMGH